MSVAHSSMMNKLVESTVSSIVTALTHTRSGSITTRLLRPLGQSVFPTVKNAPSAANIKTKQQMCGSPFSYCSKNRLLYILKNRKPLLIKRVLPVFSQKIYSPQLPFSEQNLTVFPSRIMLVVRTAHILPHIEQVWRSAGGVDS